MHLNVVDLILKDHRELRSLFDEVRNDPGQRPTLVPVLVNLLTAHSRAEEATAYPAATDAGIDDVQHSQKEHLEADQLAAAVAEADTTSPDFETKLQELRDAVLHHVEEEESGVLPKMRDAFDDDRLAEVGEQFLDVRQQHLGAMPADITAEEMRQQARNADIPVADQSKSELKQTLAANAEE